MRTRLYLLLALCVTLCWGCVSPPRKTTLEPELAFETILPPPVVDLGPKTRTRPVSTAQVKEEAPTPPPALTPPQTSLHFEFNQFSILPNDLDVLKFHAEYLRSSPSVRARLEGNTDEFGSDEFNLQLGKKRANAVKDSLVNMGVQKDRLDVTSLGKSRPVNTAHNKEAWRQNRRVDVRYLGE